VEEIFNMNFIHSFYYKTQGTPSFGRDLYHSLAGSEPKGQKKASQDKPEVNECATVKITNIDDRHKKEEYGADQVVKIFPVEIFTGADVFEEYGDLIGPPSYLIGHMNTLIGEDDLVIVGTDQ
jgi:hypothetical protein